MKKVMILLVVAILAMSTAIATDKRVLALGSNAYMLPGDVASIALFPQRINDANLIYFTDIQTTTPNYLLVVGEPGSTWGFYGGTTQKDDYFNVIRSLGSTAAFKMGLRLGLTRQNETLDDKETTPTISDETLSQTNIMLDMEYGMDMGDVEFSSYVTFGRTPDDINTLLGVAPTPHGTFTGEYESSGNSTTEEGKATRTSFAFKVKARANHGLFLFDNSYATFALGYQGGASEYTDATNTKIEDQSDSYFSMSSVYGLFNNLNIAGDNVFIVYGLKGSAFYSHQTYDYKITPGESTTTYNYLSIVAPTVNLGLEAELKYATLRFGMVRSLKTLGIATMTRTVDSGTVDDENTTSDIILGANGSYTYNAGLGFNYGALKLDILLNNALWITGPQMIFNSAYGTLGICADLIYTF